MSGSAPSWDRTRVRERVFRGPDGAYYRARLSPVEPRTGRVLEGVHWLSFTDLEERWIGAVPVELGRTMISMDTEELVGLLGEVRGRG